MRAGVAVHAFNQRDLAGILAMIRTLGALVGAGEKADALARDYEVRSRPCGPCRAGRSRPRVYFEEWDDPLISGTGWISELVHPSLKPRPVIVSSNNDGYAVARTAETKGLRIK